METWKYPVYCAWCQSEGRLFVIKYASSPDSHGICDVHEAKMQAELEAAMKVDETKSVSRPSEQSQRSEEFRERFQTFWKM